MRECGQILNLACPYMRGFWWPHQDSVAWAPNANKRVKVHVKVPSWGTKCRQTWLTLYHTMTNFDTLEGKKTF